MTKDLKGITSWLSANKLTLNVLKTDFMLIGSRQRVAALEGNVTLRRKCNSGGGGVGGRFLAREKSRTFRTQLSALFSTVTYFLLYGSYLCKYKERSGQLL